MLSASKIIIGGRACESYATMSDRQTTQQAKNDGVQRTLKDVNPTAAPIKLYLVGEERRSGNCFSLNRQLSNESAVLYN